MDQVFEMPEFKNGKKVTVRFKVSEKNIYRMEFMPGNQVKYYDAEKSILVNINEENEYRSQSLGTKNIPLGWFRDLPNFAGSWEQPYHNITIGESGSYLEIDKKRVSWGYSSHHFEPDYWSDCYGKYTLTTQNVRLMNSDGQTYTYIYDFPNVKSNYNGAYFYGTSIPVNNNATHYGVEFTINFEPTYVSGTSILCANQYSTFTLHNNSSPVYSIVWSKSSNLTYISGQGTNYYRVRAGSSSGIGWVKATLTTSCGDLTFQKDVWLGKPNFTLIGDYELGIREMGIAEVNYISSPNQGITSVNWDRSGAISSASGSAVLGKYWAGSSPGSGTVDLTLGNQCGTTFKYFIVNVTGGWYKLILILLRGI